MANLYGPPLRLAGDARAFDISPAWMSWVGQAPALELLEAVGIEPSTRTTPRWRRASAPGSGCEPATRRSSRSTCPDEAADRLAAARVRCAGRGGLTRFSFHLANTEADVDRALEARWRGLAVGERLELDAVRAGRDAELVDAAVRGAQLAARRAATRAPRRSSS